MQLASLPSHASAALCSDWGHLDLALGSCGAQEGPGMKSPSESTGLKTLREWSHVNEATSSDCLIPREAYWQGRKRQAEPPIQMLGKSQGSRQTGFPHPGFSSALTCFSCHTLVLVTERINKLQCKEYSVAYFMGCVCVFRISKGTIEKKKKKENRISFLGVTAVLNTPMDIFSTLNLCPRPAFPKVCSDRCLCTFYGITEGTSPWSSKFGYCTFTASIRFFCTRTSQSLNYAVYFGNLVTRLKFIMFSKFIWIRNPLFMDYLTAPEFHEGDFTEHSNYFQ